MSEISKPLSIEEIRSIVNEERVVGIVCRSIDDIPAKVEDGSHLEWTGVPVYEIHPAIMDAMYGPEAACAVVRSMPGTKFTPERLLEWCRRVSERSRRDPDLCERYPFSVAIAP